MNRFKSKFLAALVLAAPFAAGAQSPDGAAYSQVRDMAVRAYRAVHGATGTLAQAEATAAAAVPTNAPAYLAAVSNSTSAAFSNTASRAAGWAAVSNSYRLGAAGRLYDDGTNLFYANSAFTNQLTTNSIP